MTDRSVYGREISIVDIPLDIYLLKFSNINTGTKCEICPKLTIKTSLRRQWYRSDIFVANVELNSVVNFEHVISSWVYWVSFLQ